MTQSRELLEEIETSLRQVERSVHQHAGAGDSREEALKAIFVLNNTIGRAARHDVRTMEDLKELQSEINLITLGVKAGNTKQSEEGLRMVAESLRRLREKL